MEEARALFLKDLRAELRTKVAVSAVGVFTFSSLLLLALATAALKELKAFSEPLFYAGFDQTKMPTGVHSDAIIGSLLNRALVSRLEQPEQTCASMGVALFRGVCRAVALVCARGRDRNNYRSAADNVADCCICREIFI